MLEIDCDDKNNDEKPITSITLHNKIKTEA